MGPLSNTFEAITFAWNWKPGTEEGTPSVCAVVWEAIGIPKVNRCGALNLIAVSGVGKLYRV